MLQDNEEIQGVEIYLKVTVVKIGTDLAGQQKCEFSIRKPMTVGAIGDGLQREVYEAFRIAASQALQK